MERTCLFHHALTAHPLGEEGQPAETIGFIFTMRLSEILKWSGLMSEYPNILMNGTLLPARPPTTTPIATLWHLGALGYHPNDLTVPIEFEEVLHLNWSSHTRFSKWLALSPTTCKRETIVAIGNCPNFLPDIISLLHSKWEEVPFRYPIHPCYTERLEYSDQKQVYPSPRVPTCAALTC